MQRPRQTSLNAIRVFATVAQHNSIAGGAALLGVTASAVSHQIKNLEVSLSADLFIRSNNSITLTESGRVLLDEALPGLRILEQATNALSRDSNNITVRVSSTLAVRWLIPALDRFKNKNPGARVRIEISTTPQVRLDQSVDVAITYCSIGHEIGNGEKVLTDFSRPVLAPGLLQQAGLTDSESVVQIPAITCTDDNWDWWRWAQHFGLPFSRMKFTDHFDTDDAALHAAAAGLGMVLSPAFMAKAEIEAGTLVVLPYFEPVEMGSYYIMSGPRETAIVKAFRRWLSEELANLEASPT